MVMMVPPEVLTAPRALLRPEFPLMTLTAGRICASFRRSAAAAAAILVVVDQGHCRLWAKAVGAAEGGVSTAAAASGPIEEQILLREVDGIASAGSRSGDRDRNYKKGYNSGELS